MVALRSGNFKISDDFDTDIKEELKKKRKHYSVNLRVVDDKLIANFNYSNDKDYADYEKVFDSMEEFEKHLSKFLGIKS